MLSVVVALAGAVGAVALRDERMLLPIALVVAVGSVIVALVYSIRISFNTVSIELDASGRWVTLRGVHPNFARAVSEESSEREPVDRR